MRFNRFVGKIKKIAGGAAKKILRGGKIVIQKKRIFALLIFIFLFILRKFGLGSAFLWVSFFAFLLYGWQGRVFIGLSLVLWASCPVLLAVKRENLAETLAVYAYFLLVFGIILQVARFFKDSLVSSKSKEAKKVKEKKTAKGRSAKSLTILALAAVLVLAFGLFIFWRKGVGFDGRSPSNFVADDDSEEAEIENQQEASGEASTFSQTLDWESVKVVIDNTTGQKDLAETIADQFRKLGSANVYVGEKAGALNQKTLVEYCRRCFNIVKELLAVLPNADQALLIERAELSDEIRFRLGADQIVNVNSDITVSILNGSNIAGAAGGLRDRMAEQGFRVINIGNAEKRNYQKTVIRYSPKNLEKAQAVENYLNAFYPTETEGAEGLPVDVEIILGAESND